MIKFFRHIRRSLIQENKMGKYFKYAIGEILLVVIGILIALQINNWNTDRIAINQEKVLLQNVLENLETDAKSIRDMISVTDNILEVQQNLILVSQSQLEADQVGNIDLIRMSEPNQFITRKNNPDLANQLRDDILKKMVLDYYLNIEVSEKAIKDNNDIIEQMVRPFLAEHLLLNYGNQLEKDLSNLNLINDTRFFEAFKKEKLRQVLFESGLKLNIVRLNIDSLLLKNSTLIKAIKDYLSHD